MQVIPLRGKRIGNRLVAAPFGWAVYAPYRPAIYPAGYSCLLVRGDVSGGWASPREFHEGGEIADSVAVGGFSALIRDGSSAGSGGWSVYVNYLAAGHRYDSVWYSDRLHLMRVMPRNGKDTDMLVWGVESRHLEPTKTLAASGPMGGGRAWLMRVRPSYWEDAYGVGVGQAIAPGMGTVCGMGSCAWLVKVMPDGSAAVVTNNRAAVDLHVFSRVVDGRLRQQSFAEVAAGAPPLAEADADASGVLDFDMTRDGRFLLALKAGGVSVYEVRPGDVRLDKPGDSDGWTGRLLHVATYAVTGRAVAFARDYLTFAVLGRTTLTVMDNDFA